MRLTDNEFHTEENKERAGYIQESRLQAIYDKLFDLEDIEEELGIDLITLIKALKQEDVYVKLYDNVIDTCCFSIDRTMRNEWCFIYTLNEDDYILYKIKDYGKTWALTKEELL